MASGEVIAAIAWSGDIASLKAAGVGRVWAVEPVAHRRDMAAAMGADVILTYLAREMAETLGA